jgi:CDP-diacylglycerol--serine O-phosphatidyltransferase
MLFVIFAGYALLGPAERLVGLLVKTAGKRPSTKTEQSVTESKF